MQTTSGTIDTQQPTIAQSDKLAFCFFLAIAFHGMLLFGIGFTAPKTTPLNSGKTFNVVLAQFEAEKIPAEKDFIGQANQEGGGDSEKKLAPSAREKAWFNDPDQTATEFSQTSSAQMQPKASRVINSANSRQTAVTQESEQAENRQIPDAASLIDQSYKLSGLIANLDNHQVNQAYKGRKRAISAAIHRATDALYLDSWRRKIEKIGNLNYPQKAKTEKIYGNVTMKVAINLDGTINQVDIMQSSGSEVLDKAALSIVRMAAPFQPLTKDMAKDTDILEIIRVWQFQPDYRLKTN